MRLRVLVTHADIFLAEDAQEIDIPLCGDAGVVKRDRLRYFRGVLSGDAAVI